MINVVKIYVTIEMKSNHRMIAKISHLLDFSHFLISLRIKKWNLAFESFLFWNTKAKRKIKHDKIALEAKTDKE
jgi:hypothetical protein